MTHQAHPADALHSALLACMAELRIAFDTGGLHRKADVRAALDEAEDALGVWRKDKAPSPVAQGETPRTEGKLLSWNLRSKELATAIKGMKLGFEGADIQNRVVDANFARQLEAELTALREQVRALEEDKARLDWLLEHGVQTQHYYSDHRSGGGYVQYHRTRAAIDAARAARPASGGEGSP